MSRLRDLAQRMFRRSSRPAVVDDRDMPYSSTFATLRRHWIEPLERP